MRIFATISIVFFLWNAAGAGDGDLLRSAQIRFIRESLGLSADRIELEFKKPLKDLPAGFRVESVELSCQRPSPPNTYWYFKIKARDAKGDSAFFIQNVEVNYYRNVAVAKRKIDPGEVVRARDVKYELRNVSRYPRQFYEEKQFPDNRSKARRLILAGEILFADLLAKPAGAGGEEYMAVITGGGEPPVGMDSAAPHPDADSVREQDKSQADRIRLAEKRPKVVETPHSP